VNHGIRVSNLAYHVAKELGFYENTCHELAVAGMLHDIGKPFCFTEDACGVGHFYGHGEISRKLAEQMLRQSKKPILSISEEVGFRSLSSFNRLFRKAYGCSPRQFRTQASSQNQPTESRNRNISLSPTRQV